MPHYHCNSRAAAAPHHPLLSAVLLRRARLVWLSSLPLLASENFESGKAEGWLPKDPDHWQVVEKDGSMVYELTAPGEQGAVRAPTEWSVWTGHDATSFEFTGRMRCYTDTTIAMPLLTHYALAKHKPRKLKRLYDQREKMMEALTKEYFAHNPVKMVDGSEPVVR